MKKKVYTIACMVGIVPLLTLIAIDYLNVPSLIGLQTSNINIELFGAVLNAVVVVTLFVITFTVIDKRQLKKDDNARQTANILVLSSYKQCKETLGLLNDSNILENYIVLFFYCLKHLC